MPHALGLDAAGKAGWVGVVVGDRGFVSAHVGRLVVDVMAAAEAGLGVALDAVAIDIPIGLVDARIRSADVAARAYVGPRRSSVFPAPHPDVVHLTTHQAVNERLGELDMPLVSAQAFHLFARVREVAEIAGDRRVVEAFPEASFCAMDGGRPLLASKKTWNGQLHRRALLAAAHPPVVVPDGLGVPGLVPADDVLDAASVAWSGHRRARGEGFVLGDESELDLRTGRPAVVWV